MPDRFKDASLFCTNFQQLNKEQQLEFIYKSSRSAKVPLDYLTTKRILVVDRYSAYKKLARLYRGLTLASCWAHLRGGFLECATPVAGTAFDEGIILPSVSVMM